MTHGCGLASVALAVLAVACESSSPGSESAQIVRLDGSTIAPAELTVRIEELTRAADVQGLTVTVFNDRAVVYSHAFGFADLTTGRPLRTSTEIYGASLGKLTGKPLEQLMREEVVEPFSMTMSSYTWQPRFEQDYTVLAPVVRRLLHKFHRDQ